MRDNTPFELGLFLKSMESMSAEEVRRLCAQALIHLGKMTSTRNLLAPETIMGMLKYEIPLSRTIKIEKAHREATEFYEIHYKKAYGHLVNPTPRQRVVRRHRTSPTPDLLSQIQGGDQAVPINGRSDQPAAGGSGQ